jgi:hypothetical protein
VKRNVQARPGRRKPGSVAIATTPAPMDERSSLRFIRWLIWLYFVLLLAEGALRKWAVPSLANPLLLIRDPVVVAIYVLAFARGVFPINKLVIALAVIGTLCVIASFFAPYFNLGVSLYGWRCDVLHLPLIYVMGRVLQFSDVKRIGQWILILAVPMTALVVQQFRSVADAWVNAGAGADALQITFTGNRVRPSGTFSFVAGIIYFYALVTVFLIYGLVERRVYSIWLIAVVGLCLPVALAVSGSRSTVAMAAIVAFSFAVALFLRPSLIGKAMRLIGIVVTLVFLAGSIAIFQSAFSEGMEAFSKRLRESEHVEGGFAGFVQRFVGTFTKSVDTMFDVPFLGYGLGVGTNVGARLLTGQTDFVLAEDEWERVIAESGAFLGSAYLLVRMLLALQLAGMAVRAARMGHYLPLLLLGACGVPIVSGQFGQATVLGFTCFIAGLCMASMHLPANAAAAVVAARQPVRQRPAKVLALRAAVEARRAAARGNSWTRKLLDQST